MIFEVPAVPDAETARKLAEEELAKTKYNSGESLIQEFLNWLNKIFSRTLSDGTNGLQISDFLILGLISILLAAVIFLVIRYIRRSRIKAAGTLTAHQSQRALFDDERSSAQLFAAADAALQNRDLNLAVVERFRGVIRHLEEKRYLRIKPGMTASEAARDASAILDHQQLFFENAQWFNKVYYADFAATNDAIALSYRVMELVTALPVHKDSQIRTELVAR
ncbi:hypothetical protein JOD55_000721 [Arcanobacterium pluranimalium]|uniref:DUF4129 domain-containing protein n=1 Tax=Arcanobacterium pluranimalium TaxID=108028 RepID=UPI001957F88E|nr:DUF4129 domain-containing protein [Arcanobacterium pluranimalium]MBM7824894.1 hypothetical protein [Arcanobacterium pluranimalium]